MLRLFWERRGGAELAISSDLCRHILLRQAHGKIAVACERPTIMLKTVKKQWAKLVRQVERERACTLNTTRQLEFDLLLDDMRSLQFSARPPQEELSADVSFASCEQLEKLPVTCHTLYVAQRLSVEQLYLLTAWMPPMAWVIAYQ